MRHLQPLATLALALPFPCRGLLGRTNARRELSRLHPDEGKHEARLAAAQHPHPSSLLRRCRVGGTLALLLGGLMGLCTPAHAATFYVSTAGSDARAGTTEATAWRTLAKAAATARAGDTVYIKAGSYGRENVKFSASGTAAAPIVFEGYKSVAGDRPDLRFRPGMALDPSVMPLFDGSSRASGGVCLTVTGAHVVIRSLQVRNYTAGVRFDGPHGTVENVVVASTGNPDVYSGFGIAFANNATGGRGLARNCVVYNASSAGIVMGSSGNAIENCRVYCDDDSTALSATDYYIVIDGPIDLAYSDQGSVVDPAPVRDNIVRDCHVERIGNLRHGGHAYLIDDTAEHNQILRSTAKGFRGDVLSARSPRCAYNEWVDCTVLGGGHAIVADQGAHHNTWRNIRVDGAATGMSFWGKHRTWFRDQPNRDNRCINCVFSNLKDSAIFFNDFWDEGNPVQPVFGNKLINCVIYKAPSLFRANRVNYDNAMVNCIVSGVTTFQATGIKTLDFDVEYTAFQDNGFALPAGTGNLAVSAPFVDAAAGDFRLRSGSQCIDRGKTESLADLDFVGARRPYGSAYDLGAYEYFGTLVAPNHLRVE